MFKCFYVVFLYVILWFKKLLKFNVCINKFVILDFSLCEKGYVKGLVIFIDLIKIIVLFCWVIWDFNRLRIVIFDWILIIR